MGCKDPLDGKDPKGGGGVELAPGTMTRSNPAAPPDPGGYYERPALMGLPLGPYQFFDYDGKPKQEKK